MEVDACLHVHLSKTVNEKKHFTCKPFHTFHSYRYEFGQQELTLCNIDKENHSFRGMMLVESPFDDHQLEGYSAESNIPLVLFRFHDNESLRGFVEMATASTCVVGHRSKTEANQVDDEAVPELRASATTRVAVDQGDVADCYPVDGLTKIAPIKK